MGTIAPTRKRARSEDEDEDDEGAREVSTVLSHYDFASAEFFFPLMMIGTSDARREGRRR